METIDDLQLNGYRIIQDDGAFKFGMDAVLLSAFAAADRSGAGFSPEAHVTDLGTGTGIIPILLAGKTEAGCITGVEIQKKMADMAERSVKLNGLEDRIRIINCDMKECAEVLGKSSQNAVISNPPYVSGGHGIANENEALFLARHEAACTIDDVVRTARLLLRQGGTLYMVHRPHRLTDVLETMRKYRIEPKLLRMAAPSADRRPNIFLIKGVRDANKGNLVVEEQLNIYNSDGTYTEEVLKIYGLDR